MTKKEIRKISSMSMTYFLKTYLEIGSDDLLFKLANLSHFDLKEVLRVYGVKVNKISFDSLTKEMLAKGDVLLVEDVYGNSAPYINPMRKMENEYYTTLDEEFVSYKIVEGDDIDDKYKGKQKVKCFKP